MLNHMERVEYLMSRYFMTDEDALYLVDIYEHGLKNKYKPHCKTTQLVSLSEFNKWIEGVSFEEIGLLI